MCRLRPIAALPAMAVVLACLALTGGADEPEAEERAQSAIFQVGDTLPASRVHIVTSTGVYGLGPVPPGYVYAIADGRLIRMEAGSGKVLSILREQVRPLD